MSITYEAVIRRVAEQLDEAGVFFGHGTDNALDEAHWLVLHVAGLPVDQPFEGYEQLIDSEQVERIDTLLAQRIEQRCPLAYLIHSAWFAGLAFFVNQHVLIPRSPIAELLVDGFSDWLIPSEVHNVLDLCTGSACIGIACAYAFADAQVVASDVSCAALDVAAENVKRHQLEKRVTLLESDLFARFDSQMDGCFDLIVSNPPYVDKQDMEALPVEFRHEPVLGLAAGDDGLTLVDTILAEAGRYLAPDGLLVVEVGNSASALMDKYPEYPFLWPEFANGGDGVFVLTAEALRDATTISAAC